MHTIDIKIISIFIEKKIKKRRNGRKKWRKIDVNKRHGSQIWQYECAILNQNHKIDTNRAAASYFQWFWKTNVLTFFGGVCKSPEQHFDPIIFVNWMNTHTHKEQGKSLGRKMWKKVEKFLVIPHTHRQSGEKWFELKESDNKNSAHRKTEINCIFLFLSYLQTLFVIYYFTFLVVLFM